MGTDNPPWTDLSLAQVLIFKNEAIVTIGMQDYSIFVKSDFKIQVIKLTSLLLTTILPINGCPEEGYILPVTSPPQITYTFLLIFECSIKKGARREDAKSQEYQGKVPPHEKHSKIHFLKRKV